MGLRFIFQSTVGDIWLQAFPHLLNDPHPVTIHCIKMRHPKIWTLVFSLSGEVLGHPDLHNHLDYLASMVRTPERRVDAARAKCEGGFRILEVQPPDIIHEI